MRPSFRLLPFALALAAAAHAVPVTWDHDSRLQVSETAASNADGSYTYTLEMANRETTGIWFAAFYTGGFQAYDFASSSADWAANAYAMYAPAGEDWSLPGAADGWAAAFYDTDGPDVASLAAGASATVSFTVAGKLDAPVRFGYFTEGDYEWNRYSAVGAAVPEPSTLALLGLGLLLIPWLARRWGGSSPLRERELTPDRAGSSRKPVWRSLGWASLATFGAAVSAGAASDLAISQVYGGGGNSGATLTNDFVEIHNRGTAAVDLSGWSVQYAASAGTSWQRTLLSGTLPAGGYYLIQEAAGTGGTQALPAPDATGSIAMSATAGKVALVQSTALLSGSCPAAADFIGYGSANCFEGAAAPGLSNTTADLRAQSGCADTDNNGADFSAGAPTPRNTASPAVNCGAESAPNVVSISPAPGAAAVSVSGNVVVTFSEPVAVAGTWFRIQGSASGTHAAVVSGGPTVFTLDPAADYQPGETIAITVFAAGVSDLDTQDPPDHPVADFTSSFATAAPVKISAIQGKAHLSPLAGQAVAGVSGIVTAVMPNGFFMQDPVPDADPATSEGIFVFTSSKPAVSVGDAVSVDGRVQEFRPGSASNANLTNTELSSPVIRVLSSGNALPAPVMVGLGGRMPPHEITEDDASGSVETSGVFDPDSDGLDFWESLEGMRVKLADPVVVGPTSKFGEFFVLGDAGTGASLRTARGGIKVRPNDFNPERIMIDSALTPAPAVDVGDAFAGPIEGVLDYDFGNFRIHPASLPPVIRGGLQREVADPCDTFLTVATFNMENLDPGDPQDKFDRLAHIIVDNLRAPMLIAAEEIQDNDGPTDDGTVDASQTAAQLIAAIQAAGGPAYAYKDIVPVNDQDGGEPGGNIRVGFLYQAARGLTFISRPGATSTTSVKALKTPTGVRLNYSPGRIDPTNAAFQDSRKPLVGEFSYNGRTFFVIANHFDSKGGDDPLEGRFQPPQRSSEVQRKQQATLVNGFAQSILSLDPCARIVVLGDLNDFEFSNAVTILKGNVLTDLIETLPENQRYSYVFEGNSQTLDHILVSPNLAGQDIRYKVVHVNAEFADQASDHEPQRVCIERGPANCPVKFP